LIDRLFESKYFTSSFRYLRWPLALGPLAWGITSCFFPDKLIPSQRLEHYFPHDFWVTYRIDAFYNKFQYNYVGLMNIDFFWGVNFADRSGLSAWDTMDYGKIVWDETFNMSAEENQEAAVTFCQDIFDTPDLVFFETVNCPMMAFKTYLTSKKRDFPVKAENFDTDFYNFVNDVAEGQYFRDLAYVGFRDGKLAYYQIKFASNYLPTIPNVRKLEIFDDMTAICSKWDQKELKGMEGCMHSGLTDWTYLMMETAAWPLIGELLLFSVPFIGLVLLFTTWNLITTLVTLLPIAFIGTSVLYMYERDHYHIGASESVGILTMPVFCITYCVTFAAHYNCSPFESRQDKIREAMKAVIVPILLSCFSFILGIQVLNQSLVYFLTKTVFAI
jgi:phosphatidylglycerophosphatase A